MYPDPGAWRLPCLSFQPLAGGARNTVLLGQAPDIQVVFKSTRRSEAQLRWLEHAQRAADIAGLHVSLPLETLGGLFGYNGWTAERFIDGRQATHYELQQLSPTLLTFHTAAQSAPQRPGFSSAIDLVSEPAGGDIDLDKMPSDLVQLCRKSWEMLPPGPTTIIHADLTPANLVIGRDDKPVLLDWDEARVDSAAFDLRALGEDNTPITKAAALAFEIAICWCIEPMRAKLLSRDLASAVRTAGTWK